jgi:hypothetical protein
MIRFQIVQEGRLSPETPAQLEAKLSFSPGGSLRLCLRQPGEVWWCVVAITPEGLLERPEGLPSHLCLIRDEKGRIARLLED